MKKKNSNSSSILKINFYLKVLFLGGSNNFLNLVIKEISQLFENCNQLKMKECSMYDVKFIFKKLNYFLNKKMKFIRKLIKVKLYLLFHLKLYENKYQLAD